MNIESEEIAASKPMRASFSIQKALFAIGVAAAAICMPPAFAFYMLLVA